MKNQKAENLTIDQVIGIAEILTDQIQDLRAKLITEVRPEMIPFRLSVVTHYRNMKRTLLTSIDSEKISRRELIGFIHNN